MHRAFFLIRTFRPDAGNRRRIGHIATRHIMMTKSKPIAGAGSDGNGEEPSSFYRWWNLERVLIRACLRIPPLRKRGFMMVFRKHMRCIEWHERNGTSRAAPA